MSEGAVVVSGFFHEVVAVLGGLSGGQLGVAGPAPSSMPATASPFPLSRGDCSTTSRSQPPRPDRGPSLPANVSQLRRQGGGDKAGVLPQTSEGIGGGASAAAQEQGPYRQGS